MIAIIGARGQLGRDCMEVLRDLGELRGLDLPELDITDRKACHDQLDRLKPEVVVNCAAYTAVDACETDPACWRVNADAPGILAEWTEANGAHLLHVSTDYVFAGNRPLFEAYGEDDPTGPVSEYGRSKLGGEQAIAAATERFSILRTAWLYGGHGKNFPKTMLRLALKNPAGTIRVVDDQFGSPTWSHSLARVLRGVIEQQAFGLFHATSEGYGSWYELAGAFLEGMGVPHRVVPCPTSAYPTAARRPANSILENRRLKEHGLNLFVDWRTELERFIEQCGTAVLQETKAQL